MRQAFAAKFGELEDKHIPAKQYLEKKLAELESGEFRAEPLTEIISRDEVDPDTLLPVWDAKGALSIKKGGSKAAMPSGPEQLRLRLTVLQNALIMRQLSSEDSGSLVLPWSLVLNYEHARYPQTRLQSDGDCWLHLRCGASPQLQGALGQGAELYHSHGQLPPAPGRYLGTRPSGRVCGHQTLC